jgi:hypothetical protein
MTRQQKPPNTHEETMLKKAKEHDDSQPSIKAISRSPTGSTWKSMVTSTTKQNKNTAGDTRAYDHEIKSNKDGHLILLSINKNDVSK